MAIQYPPELLSFTSLMWQVREVSRGGGPSVLGTEQIVTGPTGRWYASLTLQIGAMSWNGSADLLAFRAFMGRLRGRAGVVNLPYFDGRGPRQLLGLPLSAPHSDGTALSDGSDYAQPVFAFRLAAAAALNAVTVSLAFPDGAPPVPGQCLTMPDGWMHEITDIEAVVGSTLTARITPWLRADYAADAAVEFEAPTSRMRLVSDESGALQIQAGQVWSNPTLEFVEAF